MFKKIPFFLFLISIYPVASLYAVNMSEGYLMDTFRPLLLSILLAGLMFLVFWWILKDYTKAALVATLLFLFFSSYGAIYSVVRDWHMGGFNLGRHRFLLVIFGIILAWFFWQIIKANSSTVGVIAKVFNIFAVVLVAFPLFSIVIKSADIRQPVSTKKPLQNSVSVDNPNSYPDVYYFILDSYGRQDYIQQYMKYDNSNFIKQLQQRGFSIVDCGLSNYSYTRLSLATSLNMEYIENLGTQFVPENSDETMLDPLIQDNRVVAEFKKRGYLIVAFATGYQFTELRDADFFFQSDPEPFTQPVVTEFEYMTINNTILSLISQNDYFTKLLKIDFPYYQKWNIQRYIIEQTKSIPELPGPKFVFIHLVTTHRPYIYQSDGSILNDARYYKLDGVPVNDDYYIQGYQYSLDYTNAYMLDLVDTIQKNSAIPPVIIIQGDHGVREPGRISILNAIALPQQSNKIYSSMTPVNTFRIIFNQLFDDHFDILPDRSYYSSVNIKPYDLVPADNANSCKIQ